MSQRLFIGTSGWNYGEWKDGFFKGVPRRDWLRHYATVFPGVEVNATFYRLVRAATFASWRAQTPEGFRFCVKGHRFVTHLKRLLVTRDDVAIERDRAETLGDRLAVVLWQLPASQHCDLVRLRGFLAALRAWPAPRHAMEFRSADWFTDEVAACLGEHGVAVCQSDAADWPYWNAVTTDLVYVRLHGHEETYASAYSARRLSTWAAKIDTWLGEGRQVHVYFDNTAEGAASRDARRLLAQTPLYWGTRS